MSSHSIPFLAIIKSTIVPGYAHLPQYANTVSYERHPLLVEYLHQALPRGREASRKEWS
jgi:hypothetical protein